MKSNILKIVSTVLTITMLILYFSVHEETLFSTWIGIVVVFLFVTSVLVTMRAVLQYSKHNTKRGSKHREKLINFNLMILFMMFMISILYFVDYFWKTPFVLLVIVLLSLVFLIGYFAASFIFNYVILTENGFVSNYFLKLKKIEIKYSEITEIKFGKLMNALYIYKKDEYALVDIALIDIHVFLNELSKATLKSVHQQAFDDLGKYFKTMLATDNLSYLDYFNKNEGDS